MAGRRQFNGARAFALTLVLVAVSAGADEIRKWRDPDGGLHYSIAGSAETADERELAPVLKTREATTAEKFSIDASLRRRELERALRAASADLRSAHDEMQKIREQTLVAYSPRATTNPADVQRLLDAQRDAFLAVRAFEDDRDERLRKQSRRERDRLKEIIGFWTDFEALRQRVLEIYGTTPIWWRPLDCRDCLTAEQATAALEKRDEDRVASGTGAGAAEASAETPASERSDEPPAAEGDGEDQDD